MREKLVKADRPSPPTPPTPNPTPIRGLIALARIKSNARGSKSRESRGAKDKRCHKWHTCQQPKCNQCCNDLDEQKSDRRFNLLDR